MGACSAEWLTSWAWGFGLDLECHEMKLALCFFILHTNFECVIKQMAVSPESNVIKQIHEHELSPPFLYLFGRLSNQLLDISLHS